MKKINCKHGLDKKQEIEARRLKNVLLSKSSSEEQKLRIRICNLFREYVKARNINLYDYMKVNDIVLYSAVERAGGIKSLYEFMDRFRSTK